MAQPSRLSALPGYDTAPDIYETAETDDASTTLTQQTSPRSPSDTDETTDEEDDEESYGVSRRRLYPERARQRFTESAGKVQAKGVDLSDRVDGKRKGYRLRRRREGDADEEEGLEARIARLRREVEECRAEAEREREEAGEEGEDARIGDEVDGLTRLLASLDVPAVRPRAMNGTVRQPTVPPDPDGDAIDEQTLTRVADFDTRLSALESALGISSLDAAATGSDGVASPLIPSLNALDQQLSALSSASSLSGLEAARSQIHKLRTEAIAASRHQAAGSEDDDAPSSISAEDLEKLQALYQLIPTLSSLTPTVPPLLSRLRSLRTLHTTAANAGSDLDEIEGRQREMETELKEWREGLERIEGNVKKAGEANVKNGEVIEEWVDELNDRVKKLER